MKSCPVCGIKTGGRQNYCPLCQNELNGETNEEHCYFPQETELRKKSLVYKIQLFSGVAGIIISLMLDFMTGLHGSFHWSIIAVSGIILAETAVKRLMRKSSGPADYIINITVCAAILLLLFAHYLGFMQFTVTYILPSALTALLGTLFGFFIADKKGVFLSYLISVTVLSIIAPAVIIIFSEWETLLWKINLTAGLLSLAGLIIFIKSRFFNELQKRFHV